MKVTNVKRYKAGDLPIIAGRDKAWAFLMTESFLRRLDDKLEAFHDSRMMGSDSMTKV